MPTAYITGCRIMARSSAGHACKTHSSFRTRPTKAGSA
jgi:hypothetical protein